MFILVCDAMYLFLWFVFCLIQLFSSISEANISRGGYIPKKCVLSGQCHLNHGALMKATGCRPLCYKGSEAISFCHNYFNKAWNASSSLSGIGGWCMKKII